MKEQARVSSMENLEEVPAEQGGVGKESHLNYVNFRQKRRPQIRVCISYFRDNYTPHLRSGRGRHHFIV